jgi:ABC-2 type transport system ATP-binding protein
VLRLEHLTKSFGDNLAVDDLTLEVEAGQICVLLGPNAAGKTTTIKLIVGLLRPTAGRVFIAGIDIQTDPLRAKRLISYIPDFPYLYEKLTAREFLQFVGKIYGLQGPGLEELSGRLLSQFGLSRWQDQLIENYSHGMRQRLVICAALLHEPAVFLIDEPLVGLDPRSAKLFKDILREKSRGGCSVLVSTHNLSIAEELADRIAIIDRGRLVSEGAISRLRELSGVDGHLEEIFLRLTREEMEV